MHNILEAKENFIKLIEKQLSRIEMMKGKKNPIDFKRIDVIKIGVCSGDGIGPIISEQARKVLYFLLKKEMESGKIRIRDIDGLTIERRIAEQRAVPNSVLKEIKECDVILKGPTTTPRQGDGMPNIESANVALRKALDLFANVRPISIPTKAIEWIFFRENTEGSYAMGNEGVQIAKELSLDFTVATSIGCERIIRAAFEYAVQNNKKHVTAITKANIIKTTDGEFLRIFYEIAKEYPDITADDWYIDIMTAKLLDLSRSKEFQIMVLPNLYGDIITDEAAQLQGGVGTGGSENIRNHYAMFEAVHGSAPRMIAEGRGKYANPCSMIRAAEMLLRYIGYEEKAEVLNKALNSILEDSVCQITGNSGGMEAEEWTDELIRKMENRVVEV